MDDNTRPHRAGVVDTFLQNHAIARMNWPARSPDLNPIEHVWDKLGRRISSLQPPLRNTHELETALKQEWALIPQELINSLILRWNLKNGFQENYGAIRHTLIWNPKIPTTPNCETSSLSKPKINKFNQETAQLETARLEMKIENGIVKTKEQYKPRKRDNGEEEAYGQTFCLNWDPWGLSR
ncbi:MAP4K1 [Cordylochernes scorpioides]|uniref:MAP4K1 n=1 Tax=Cordylochernes scorpioides TaxID=51811 RepID=A0ABY6K3M5_9ARAC|nr:MAP4K1 [Cordylochernes scorpioides]